MTVTFTRPSATIRPIEPAPLHWDAVWFGLAYRVDHCDRFTLYALENVETGQRIATIFDDPNDGAFVSFGSNQREWYWPTTEDALRFVEEELEDKSLSD